MDKEKILEYLKTNGPSLPLELSSKLGGDSFFMSAHLSELKEHGHIRISSIKIGGGSPLYYLPGQEKELQNFSDNLGDKQKKIYEILKEKKIVKDSNLVPVFRAAIRTIKDFALPINVNTKDGKELFWKWIFLDNEEAETIVKKIIGITDIENKRIDPEKDISEVQRKLEKPLQTELEQIQEKTKVKKEIPKSPKKDSQTFHNEVMYYFSKNNIKVIDQNIIRKASDIEFTVEVPSSVGTLKYFVKAKSKKKINEGDLSTVFIIGQTKRLPVLYLSKGSLTKKANEMLESEFKGMRFNNI